MPIQPTNKLKFTMWTPTLKADYSGSIDEGVVTAFRGLSTPERRAKALQEMKEADERMTAFEKEKAGK